MSGDDDEIVVALTAQTEQFNEEMQRAGVTVEAMQAKVVQEAQAFNAATQAKMDAMLRLNAAFQKNVGTADGMLEAERALDQAMSAGALSTAEYATYVERLNAAEAAAAVSAEATAAAIGEQNAAMGISGGVARELSVMLGEVLRGNYGRLEMSASTLANRSGLLQAAFTPLGAAALGVGAAAVWFTEQLVKAQEQTSEFERVLQETGGIIGMTEGQLEQASAQIAAFSGRASQANEIVTRLAASGKFSGETLQAAAQGASNAMLLTGESAQQAVAQMEKLGENPVEGIIKLDQQFHFLTADVLDHIEKLQRAGDQYGALQVAATAFAEATSSRVDELNQKMGWFEKQISLIKVGYDTIDESMRRALDPTLEEQAAEAAHKWQQAQYQLSQALKEGNQRPYEAQYIEGLRQEEEKLHAVAQALRQKVLEQQHEAQEGGKKAQANAELTREIAAQDQFNAHLKETSLLQEKIAEMKQRVEAIHASDPGSGSIQGLNFDSDGKLEETGAQWSAILAKLQHEFGETKQHAISMHRALTEQLQEAEAADHISFDQRRQYELQFWQSKLATMKSGTVEYAQAYMQVQNLQHEIDQQRVSEARKAEEQIGQAYKDEVSLAVRAINDFYEQQQKQAVQRLQLGQITNQQELALLQRFAEQEYQTELGILQHYRELMSEKPHVVQEINKQIEELQAQHKARMDQINQQETKDAVTTWDKRLAPITHGFNQSISGMIMGTQTLKQGMDRMFQSILLSEIQTDAQRLQHWVSTEIAKVGAAAAGAEATKTIQSAAAAQTKAEDAANAKGEITNAAATAGAKAYQAVVGIPIVGPILAPIAAGVAFAGVEAFGSDVSSAAGGWDRVPYDDAPALLHRNEMVLSAPLADRVRGMTDPGGGGGSIQNITINANHPKDFYRQLTADPRMLAKAAQLAARVHRRGR
jgi:phage-related minor tail protein